MNQSPEIPEHRSDTLWSLRDVSLVTGGSVRLDHVALEIESGITAILGESGAGKSSFINLLADFERPTSGAVTRTIDPANSAQKFALPVFWMPQGHGLWPHMTCREHIEHVNVARETKNLRSTDEWLATVDLAHRASERPAALSQGERARLALARCLAADAAILLMDEPFAHIDAQRVTRLRDEVVRHCRDTGCSLIFTTHNPESVLACAHRVICLQNGQMLAHDTTHALYFSPANPETSRFLGPANWIDLKAGNIWLENESELLSNGQPSDSGFVCIRPEQLDVGEGESAGIQVVHSRFLGTISETQVRHDSGREQTFFHRSGRQFAAGDRISFRVLPPPPEQEVPSKSR